MTVRVVVTGGAGFIGSHLCERFLDDGCEVVAVDNFVTGSPENVAHLRDDPAFRFHTADITRSLEIDGPVDAVLNLASAASPIDYLRIPLETLEVGSSGTRNCLELARAKDAQFLTASTSEVYGDPLVHPQPESYWGNVNPIGPRSVYDEAKRFSEAMTMAYSRTYGMPTHIVRIFNTIGERMRPDDGRAVPTFAMEALTGRPLTIFGDGSHTRSVGYVKDVVDGIVLLLKSDVATPVNIGNPEEITILDLARLVAKLAGNDDPEVEFKGLPQDDPHQRRPDISKARELLGWEPTTSMEEAVRRTVEHFRSHLQGFT